MPIVKVKPWVKTKTFDPTRKLNDPSFILKAFCQAMNDNDIEAALDAIDGYLMATGRMEIATSILTEL